MKKKKKNTIFHEIHQDQDADLGQIFTNNPLFCFVFSSFNELFFEADKMKY